MPTFKSFKHSEFHKKALHFSLKYSKARSWSFIDLFACCFSHTLCHGCVLQLQYATACKRCNLAFFLLTFEPCFTSTAVTSVCGFGSRALSMSTSVTLATYVGGVSWRAKILTQIWQIISWQSQLPLRRRLLIFLMWNQVIICYSECHVFACLFVFVHLDRHE